jgi:hypothetical protein
MFLQVVSEEIKSNIPKSDDDETDPNKTHFLFRHDAFSFFKALDSESRKSVTSSRLIANS